MNRYANIDKNKSMSDIAYEILKVNGKSMFYKDIWKIMEEDVGYKSHGKSPETSLNSVLGRDSRFFKHRGMVELLEWIEEEKEEEGTIYITECPKCNEKIQTDFNYCPCCRSQLDIKKICQYCESSLEDIKDSWKICPYCGEELTEYPMLKIELKEENEEEEEGDVQLGCR